MSNQQYPQQPGWGGPPQQPYGAPPFQPQPPKKSGAGRIIGFGCLGIIGLFLLIGIVAAVAGGSGDSGSKKSEDSGKAGSAAAAPENEKAADDDKAGRGDEQTDDKKAGKEKSSAKVVVFKVWGTAPGGVDIDYGSDSDSRSGRFKGGEFEATLPLSDDALYFHVMGQLQGGGDIKCSVTVDGETKKGHASGDYNICDAQVNSGLLGGWD